MCINIINLLKKVNFKLKNILKFINLRMSNFLNKILNIFSCKRSKVNAYYYIIFEITKY